MEAWLLARKMINILYKVKNFLIFRNNFPYFSHLLINDILKFYANMGSVIIVFMSLHFLADIHLPFCQILISLRLSTHSFPEALFIVSYVMLWSSSKTFLPIHGFWELGEGRRNGLTLLDILIPYVVLIFFLIFLK